MTAADSLWCVLQVTLVALLAAGVYLSIRVRSPQSAIGILLAGLTLPAVLTAAVCSPWPCWITAAPAPEPMATSAVVPPIPETFSPSMNVPQFAPLPVDAASPVTQTATIESAPAVTVAKASQPTTTVTEWNWPRIGLAVMAILLVVGIARLIAGWLAVRKLLAGSLLIKDGDLLSLCADLQSKLKCTRAVEIRECPPLTTAATIGWRHPTILLPPGWASWSAAELRAVLAHELAHIARGHFGAWIVAQCGLSLHVYHPLLHWLAARLRLEQEFEADALAAQVSGGATEYLRTLAHLALTQPERPVSWPARAFLSRPGLVVRRVQRLRASHENVPSRFLLRAAVVLLVLCGTIAAAGLRRPSIRTEAAADPVNDVVDSHPTTDQTLALADPADAAQTADADHSITWCVTTADGQPVDDAMILLPFGDEFGTAEHPLETHTDADGRYRLDVSKARFSVPRWQRPLTVWAYKVGHALGIASPYSDSPPGDIRAVIDIRLQPESRPSFTIVDENGQPVAGAPVTVPLYHGENSVAKLPTQLLDRCSATTDSAGQVTIPGVSRERVVTIRTQTEPHGIQQFDMYRIADGAPLVLREAVPLTGRITSDHPEWIRNIRVRFETMPTDAGEGPHTKGYAEITTDDNGRFEVPRLATGSLLIWDQLDPALPVRIHYPKFGPPIVPSEKPLEFPLEAGIIARGRVVRDDNSQPVAGVVVGIGHGEQYQMERATTDADGEYQVRIIPEYVTFNTLHIPDPDLIDLRIRPAEITEIPPGDEPYQLPDLALFPTETRSGSLVYPDGAPAVGCRVCALGRRTENGQEFVIEYGDVRVDPQGEFTMKVPKGVFIKDYNYRTTTGHQGPTTVVHESPLLLRAEPIAGVKQPVAAAARETTGDDGPDAVDSEFIVNDEQGGPIPTGTLRLRGYYENGDFFEQDRPINAGRATFQFRRPLLSELTLSLTATGFQSHRRQSKVEGTDRGFVVARQYVLRLKPGVPIGGKVVNEAGNPLAGVHVFLSSPSTTREDGSSDFAEGWFQTDADGNWTCPGVAPDLTQLGLRFEHATHVSATYDASARFEHQAVKPQECEGLLALSDVRVMHEDPPLIGKVVAPDGKPVANVSVEISGRDPDWSQHLARGLVIKSNEAGEFRVPRPPRGEQRLTLRHPDGIRQVVEVTVPPPAPLTITLKKGRRMEFRVVDTSGRPIPDVTFLPDVSGAEFRGKTDADGRWVWENAPDEKVSYQIVSNDYLCQPPNSDYGPDDSPVTLTLRRNLPVIGKVVDAETGRSISEFRLYKGSHFRVNRSDLWHWSMQSSRSFRPAQGSWAEGKVDGQPQTQLKPGEFQHRLYTLDRLIRFRVQADGYLPDVSEPLDAAALPDQPVELEFRLKKYDRIVATVRTPTGDPAATAEIATLLKRGDDSATLSVHNGEVIESSRSRLTVAVQSDAAGRFELPVHNDPFVCLITHQTGYLELLDRELAEQSEWTLRPWQTIAGTVQAQQAPAPSVQLAFLQSGRNTDPDGGEVPGIHYSLSATTDAAGQYRTVRGFPGDWDLLVSYPAPPGGEPENAGVEQPSPWRSSRFNFDVTDADNTVLDIGRDGVDVIGRVVVPEGMTVDWPYSGVEFMCDLPVDATGRSRRESYQARLSPDGTFRCFNVLPGDYRCTAIVGTADDPVWSGWNMTRKRGFEGKLQLTADRFTGKSAIDPLDLGEIRLAAVEGRNERPRVGLRVD